MTVATAILCVFLCNISIAQDETLKSSPEWKKMVEIWGKVTSSSIYEKEEIDKIKSETKEAIDDLRQSVKKKLVAETVVKFIEKEINTKIHQLDYWCEIREMQKKGPVSVGLGPPFDHECWRIIKDDLPRLKEIAKEDILNYWVYKNLIVEKDARYGAYLEEQYTGITEEQKEAVKQLKEALRTILNKLIDNEKKLSLEEENKCKKLVKDLESSDSKKKKSAFESLRQLLNKTPVVIPLFKDGAKSKSLVVALVTRSLLESVGSLGRVIPEPPDIKTEAVFNGTLLDINGKPVSFTGLKVKFGHTSG
jgi:hypothetical protein